MNMEKEAVSEESSLLPRQRAQRRNRLHLSPAKPLLAAVLLAGFFVLLRPKVHICGRINPTDTVPESKPFDWRDVSAKPHLDYVPCYDHEYLCARLEVPMDYWNGTTDEKVGLALIRSPAPVPVTHPRYGGAILLNPGGPGGSGISFLQGYRNQVRDVLEGHHEEDKFFDLISFDPRGVGDSTPRVQCFDDPVLDESWSLRVLEEGVFSSSDAAFGRIWSLTQLHSGVCSLPTDGTNFKKYVSTASVARDMLEIVERHGEWREAEAKRRLKEHKSRSNADSYVSAEEESELLESLKYRPDEEKIQYLGFSYGSYLGNTFAAMYPDRIHRLVVDGVVDAYDYTKSLWFDNLVDTEKDMDLFYHHCARVGYPTCALANETGTTTEDGVKERTLNIIQSLYHNPLPVYSPVPEVISYSDVKLLILTALYSPIQMFPMMSALLADLERGEGHGIAMFGLHRFNCEKCCEFYKKCDSLKTFNPGVFRDASTAIACGDGDDQSSVTKEEFKEHMQKISKLSPTIGEIWANHRLKCIHWGVRPVNRFRGPWKANTSHPILEIGNTADPVTPGRYAKKMAEGFPGAVALIQDSAGHCSLSTPSNCTETYARLYFQKGELPEPGTICPADEIPFGSGGGEEAILDEQTLRRRTRAADFARAMHRSGGFSSGLHFGRASWLS